LLNFNTVDKLNKSKLSGLVNVFTVVLLLVPCWWWFYCLFLNQWMMVRWLTTPLAAVAVGAVAAAVIWAVAAMAAVDNEGSVQWWQGGGVQWRLQHLTTTVMDYG
jgi:hypothetical protein